MANQLMQQFCQEFLLYLLEVKDENQLIINKIFDEDWGPDRELWITNSLLDYLGNGLDYKENGVVLINGRDVRCWEGTRKILNEITKYEHNAEIKQINADLRDWRIEYPHAFYSTLIYNYYYRFVHDRTDEELITFLRELIHANIIIPK
jgi:hypothetical protein